MRHVVMIWDSLLVKSLGVDSAGNWMYPYNGKTLKICMAFGEYGRINTNQCHFQMQTWAQWAEWTRAWWQS